MAEETKIAWTDATWNPWQGCHKVSQGCKFCYAERWAKKVRWDFTYVHRSADKTFNAPLTWKEPKLVFTCSISDFFIEEADAWRGEAWEIIRKTPWLTYQILTKRPENIPSRLPEDWGEGWPNVWLGISAENRDELVIREIKFSPVRAKVKFLSIEPLLESISGPLRSYVHDFDWVIIGGESGNKGERRDCELMWINGVINVCKDHLVPVFVKQMGTGLAKKMGMKDWHGGDIEEFPKQFQIREWPKNYSPPSKPFPVLVEAVIGTDKAIVQENLFNNTNQGEKR